MTCVINLYWKDELIFAECEILGCTDKCIFNEDVGAYKCGCNPGYKLDMDNTTCIEEGESDVTLSNLLSVSLYDGFL